MSAAPPVFGKRNAAAAPPPRTAAPLQSHAAEIQPGADYTAFLAATREEFAKLKDDGGTGVVPRSVLAALLAGVIVGCCLVGLDIARAKDAVASGEMIDLSALLGGAAPTGAHGDSGGISPSMVVAGVLGGARAAAACLLIGHEALSRLGLTSHIAYVLGGAASALAFAGFLALALGMPPSHGWVIAGLAGAGAGFFYRMFAGRRTA